ncbi:MAG TPA: DUF302 domain-containing protein [Candidatus Aminicenantes bacterium]|nr:DUF302 domain-containing protein [Candidatus Aminicenantes bacterium]
MYHIIESEKSFEQAAADLETAVERNQFGVLHIHDLGNSFRKRGLDFIEECRVFEVCSPVHAAGVLSVDMRLNMALPCRISVYTEMGKTRIGFIRPQPMLAALSKDQDLARVAAEVESAMLRMVQEAGGR